MDGIPLELVLMELDCPISLDLLHNTGNFKRINKKYPKVKVQVTFTIKGGRPDLGSQLFHLAS